jgi:chaperonin GroES
MIEQDPETTQLNALMSMTNIAPVLDEVDLEKIGVDVKKYYMVDKDSRAEWEDRQDDYMELAAQVLKRKSFPWADASNVKYPLLSIASLQFAARAYQALIPNKNLVRAQIVGEDPDGEKFKK